MKIRSLLASLILLEFLACSNTHAGNAGDDHLVPFKPSVYDELRPTLYQKLCVTPANYGRMIELPTGPEQTELAVSIYCEETSVSGSTCSVTLTRAGANLDYIMQEQRGRQPLKAVNKVKVVRKDASIPKATAYAVRAAWSRFLRRSKPSPSRPNEPIILHATKTEFWLVTTGKTIKAETPRSPGQSVMKLVTLGRVLVRYCEEPESARVQLAKEIESDAKQLAARTDGDSR
jgi:hypothetical protein